jgi:trans-aconitate methyltransferase
MALPKLYRDLAHWWPLFSHPDEYGEEASLYRKAFEEHSRRPVRTLLELGSGGGNNASHLKERFELTLMDISPDMLTVSRELNPETEHVQGDMRTIRLGRRFDAVLIQDAVMYMATEEDLRAAMATAAAHLEPGGLALFVPDETTETYRPHHSSGGNDGDEAAVRYFEWSHPVRGTLAHTTYVYVIRDRDGEIRVEWEDHVTGLFPRTTWLRLIEEAGLEPLVLPYDHSDFDTKHEMFAGYAP